MMRLLTLTVLAVSVLLCPYQVEAMGAKDKVIVKLPASGMYRSGLGDEFIISRVGNNGLLVKSVSGSLCVTFKLDNALRGKELSELRNSFSPVHFRGEACRPVPLKAGEWTALASEKKANVVIIFPPDSFKNPSVKPMELELISATH